MNTDACAERHVDVDRNNVITYSYAGHTATFPPGIGTTDLTLRIRAIHNLATEPHGEERARHRRELDQALLVRDRAVEEREDILNERDEVLQRVEIACQERDKATQARDQCQAELTERREALRNVRALLEETRKERDTALDKARRRQTALDDTAAANRLLRSENAALRDDVTKTRNGVLFRSLRDQLDTTRRERDYYRDELNTVSGGWEARVECRRELDDQIEAVTKERDKARSERDVARAAHDDAIKEARDATARLREAQEYLTQAR